MSEIRYDVAGIGSPLLDFTVQVDESVLENLNLTKGHMHLVDAGKSQDIFRQLAGYKIDTTPGGSSANTLAGIAILGGSGILFGKVGNDSNADFYIKETEKGGVKSGLTRHSSMTGHAITLITPDSERTFATHLGAALHFRKEDVIAGEIKRSRILHVEGYLLELPPVREAALYAMDIARNNNVKVSVDLADPGLISRIPEVIDDVVRNYTNIVFVNEQEAKAFTGRGEEESLNIIYSMCGAAVVKLGEQGSLIKMNDRIYRIPAFRTEVVNTNGAGDMYAAGVLYGIARDLPIDKAGRIGSYISSKVVSQVGARLKDKVDISEIG